MFSIGRQPSSAQDLALWMAETMRLLSDLPHDIVAHAIDQAVKTSKHGHMPSVGEIRQIADPLASEREQNIARLAKMEAALADPVATAERQKHLEAIARQEEHRAEMNMPS